MSTVNIHQQEEDSYADASFYRLDATHTVLYSANVSPAVEVVPTETIDVSKLEKPRFGKQFGKPKEKINTRHVLGKEIDTNHINFALAAGMQLGIRESVGGMYAMEQESLDQDCEEELSDVVLIDQCYKEEKVKIPPGAYVISSHVASLPYRYKFKAYAPKIFSRIRDLCGVEKQRFLHSICGNDSFIEFVSNAKSGMFFFYSHDGRYMIKTQTQEEKNFLTHILPQYYRHIKKNPNTLVTHFYGMYRVKIPDLNKSVHFVIMKSVFNTEKEIHAIWDLKGSTLGRRAKKGDGVRKDLDFMDEQRKLHISKESKEAFISQMRRDADFLARMQIMDYSLLMGVHLCTKAEMTTELNEMRQKMMKALRTNTPMRRFQFQNFLKNARESFGSMRDSRNSVGTTKAGADSDDRDASSTLASTIEESTRSTYETSYTLREDFGIESRSGDLKEIYFCGIIDILQNYNARKWGETQMRKAIGGQESEISCVSPNVYADRFVNFIDSIVEVTEK